MATGISYSSKERTNFTRLCRLLIDGGTRALRDFFDSIHPPSSLHTVLHSVAVHSALKSLRAKRVLNNQQWQKLYPCVKTNVTSSGFDITLLFLLLRNICSLSPPPTGWDSLPTPSNQSKVADLIRIKFYRNSIFAHISDTSMSDAEFQRYWSEIEGCLLHLGGARYEKEIQRLRVESMDAVDEDFYVRMLEDCEDHEKRLNTHLKETEHRVASKVDEAQQAIEEKIEQSEDRITKKLDEVKDLFIHSDSPELPGDRVTNVSNYSITVSDNAQAVIGTQASYVNHLNRKTDQSDGEEYQISSQERTLLLKASSRKQTEFQHKLLASHMVPSVKTDDIFTNLVIQHGRKPLALKEDGDLDISRQKQLDWYSKAHGVPITRCEEIFTGGEIASKLPRYILVIGKPGIGKSIFCEKITRDWACDRLFQSAEASAGDTPNFNFVYLLTFRQLSSLEDGLFSLQDVLNRSALLDEQSSIDDLLFDYLLHHPEELLIIIDGYDEFSRREEIVGVLEEKYPNDPQAKMPVAAICSKLLKGKTLRGSALMITSRPGEADELGDIFFDEYVEITGFSSHQVKEYIEKYFKSEEEIKAIVVDHIMANETLVSFGHIPILCLLMCWYMEWHIRFKSAADLPVTITDLFTDVIHIFLQKHHSEIKRPSIGSVPKLTSITQSLLQFFQRKQNAVDNGAVAKPSSNRWKLTLEKLSVLAATLLLQRKMAFGEEDMRNVGLLEEEIENLKASGLLYCGPGFRNSAFEVIQSFCFAHLSIQEFLTANWFYKERRMPSKIMATGMVVQFMAGLAARSNDDKLLEKIIKWIQKLRNLRRDEKQLLTTKCLFEFKDMDFAETMVRTHYHRYYDEGRSVIFLDITDADCSAISFLIDIFSSLNENGRVPLVPAKAYPSLKPRSPFDIPYNVYIGMSSISPFGLRRICQALLRDSCSITELVMFDCGISDDCAPCIAELMTKGKFTLLSFGVNKMTDQSVEIISQCLVDEKCTLTRLGLPYNQISNKGAELLGQALLNDSCHLTGLWLNNNESITNDCKESLRKLVKEHKPGDFKLTI